MRCTVILTAVLAASVALAQPPQQQEGERRFGGPGGGPGGGMRMSPSLRILDTDGDGVLSAAEIKAAPAAFARLDKNNDHKLTEDELRPQFMGGRGPEGMRREEGREGGREGGPRREGGGPGGPPQEARAMSATDTVNTFMQFDKNGDGKLDKGEVPERMQGIFTRYDANKDGILTRDELMAGASKVAESGNREMMGGGGRRGGPPGGGIMRFDPILAAVDADHNGEISEAEWNASPAAIAKLDANHDGKLEAEELRPSFPPQGAGPEGERRRRPEQE